VVLEVGGSRPLAHPKSAVDLAVDGASQEDGV
jgi:hypothetical protein